MIEERMRNDDESTPTKLVKMVKAAGGKMSKSANFSSTKDVLLPIVVH